MRVAANKPLAIAVAVTAGALVLLVGAKAEPETVKGSAQQQDVATAPAISVSTEPIAATQAMTPAREPVRSAILRVRAQPRFGPFLRLDVVAPQRLQRRPALVTTTRLERVCKTRPQSPVPSCFWVRSGRSSMERIRVRAFQAIQVYAPVRRKQRTLITIAMRSFGGFAHRIEVKTVRAITRGRRVVVMPPSARL